MSKSVPFLLRGLLSVLMVCALATVASAQLENYAESGLPDDPGLKLLQEEAHDMLYLKQSAGGGWAKLRLLNFPGRKLPADRSGSINFEVIGIEGKKFTCKWAEIEMIDLWEVRLERETRERIDKKDFSGAYPFLSVLIRDYPHRPNLRDLRCEFLWKDAINRAEKSKNDNKEIGATLAMLEELRRYAPEYKPGTVINAIDVTIDKLMELLMVDAELDLAQQLLARIKDDYQNDRLNSVDKWDREFLAMAEEKRDAARAAMAEQDYRKARVYARESVYLKPDIPGGQTLIDEIDTIYPLVNVGVLQSATVFEPTRIDNWAARRAGRLLYRTAFEIKKAGPEGGEYDFIFGEMEISPDQMQFDLFLKNEKLIAPLDKITSYYLADKMSARAQESSSTYYSPWAAAVQSISLEGPKQVSFRLRRPHVLPICLLQIPVDGSWFGEEKNTPTGDYRRDVVEDDLQRFVLSGEPKIPEQPREIVEIRTGSASEGVTMLLQGKIDVLDQLFPADAVRLSKSNKIKVVNYPLPTVHMLVPCSDHPYVAERTFRRALLYGINREDILSGELLESLKTEGCRVISGPFPAGVDLNDSLGYAYDHTIEPRRYEPPLAKLLVQMNDNQMKAAAERKDEVKPDMTPIRLAFPADNLSRVACEAIRSQWQLLDLEVELVELPIGRTFPDEGTADIVYVSAAVWEPILDARRILGPEGLARSENQLIGLGLRRLEEARNWRQVRDGLLDLHAITHHELPILPLWQMVDSYAYREGILGVGSDDIVALYQNADNWRLGK